MKYPSLHLNRFHRRIEDGFKTSLVARQMSSDPMPPPRPDPKKISLPSALTEGDSAVPPL